ncbi:MAG: hypothetical protein ACOC1O_00085 [bacterium]
MYTETIKDEAKEFIKKNPSVSLGQAVYSICHAYWPSKVDRLTNTKIDPSKLDSRVDDFLRVLETLLQKGKN